MFQYDNTLVNKAMTMKTWFTKFGLEEPECPAQSPDLKHKHSYIKNSIFITLVFMGDSLYAG